MSVIRTTKIERLKKQQPLYKHSVDINEPWLDPELQKRSYKRDFGYNWEHLNIDCDATKFKNGKYYGYVGEQTYSRQEHVWDF